MYPSSSFHVHINQEDIEIHNRDLMMLIFKNTRNLSDIVFHEK